MLFIHFKHLLGLCVTVQGKKFVKGLQTQIRG